MKNLMVLAFAMALISIGGIQLAFGSGDPPPGPSYCHGTGVEDYVEDEDGDGYWVPSTETSPLLCSNSPCPPKAGKVSLGPCFAITAPMAPSGSGLPPSNITACGCAYLDYSTGLIEFFYEDVGGAIPTTGGSVACLTSMIDGELECFSNDDCPVQGDECDREYIWGWEPGSNVQRGFRCECK